MASLIFT